MTPVDLQKIMARLDQLEKAVAGNRNTPPISIGIEDAFIGKVTEWDHDKVTVAPMVFGDPDDWATAKFEEENECGCWSGVGTLTPPDTVVICFKLTNSSRIIAVPIYNLVGDWVVGPEFKACEPAAADLAAADPSTCALPEDWTDINCPGEPAGT